MFGQVVAWYAKRIVNVNINIILAAVLALVPMLGVVRIAEYLLTSGLVKNAKLQTHHKLVITGVTFLADVLFDVAIYFALHWVAHHMPRRIAGVEHRIEGVADAAAEHVPFFKDAVKVQMQRAVLSPLLYFLFLGIQFVLMSNYDVSASWATVIGLAIAMGVVRTIHTFWMLREERRQRARCFVAGLPKSGDASSCTVVPDGGATARPSNGHSGAAGTPAQSLSENGEKSVSRS